MKLCRKKESRGIFCPEEKGRQKTQVRQVQWLERKVQKHEMRKAQQACDNSWNAPGLQVGGSWGADTRVVDTIGK